MIISMDDYRRLDKPSAHVEPELQSPYGNYDSFGNTAPKLRLATVEAEPSAIFDLPVHFRNFDARAFIERAYALATQI